MNAQLARNPQQMEHQLETLATRQQLSHRITNLAASLHLLLANACRVAATGISIAAQLPADGRRGPIDQSGNPTQAQAPGMANLKDDAFFSIRHNGSTVPERSDVVLSFCGRPNFTTQLIINWKKQ